MVFDRPADTPATRKSVKKVPNPFFFYRSLILIKLFLSISIKFFLTAILSYFHGKISFIRSEVDPSRKNSRNQGKIKAEKGYYPKYHVSEFLPYEDEKAEHKSSINLSTSLLFVQAKKSFRKWKHIDDFLSSISPIFNICTLIVS